MDLLFESFDVGRQTVLCLGGEVAFDTAPHLRERVVELIAAGRYDLIIDLDRVEFLDSAGLGVLVGALKRTRAHNGSLRLLCAQTRVLTRLRTTGLVNVFEIHDSIQDALKPS